MRTRRFNSSAALIALVLSGLSGCGRLSAPSGASSPGPGPVANPVLVRETIVLASAAPDVDRVRVGWRFLGFDAGSEPGVALAIATDPLDLFTGASTALPAGVTDTILEGLSPATEYWVGLAVDQDGTLTQVGSPLVFRTAAPIYVDFAADPVTADGSTPDTAYNDLFLAVLVASASGGGNVWIGGGVASTVAIPNFDGVDLYGGFAPGLLLEERDPTTNPTVLRGIAGEVVLSFGPGGNPRILDGVTIDGLGVVPDGLEIVDAPASVRSVDISGCGRGIKLRSPPAASASAVSVVSCDLSSNLVQGMSVDGSFAVTVEGCSFRSNGNEGLDMDDLYASNGEQASAHVRACGFVGNGAEGMDLDLNAPSPATGAPGSFDVRIDSCDFEANGSSGLLVDVEYETAPGWSAELVVRGCRMRANGAHGIFLDVDSTMAVLLHRIRSTANFGDGILVTSESHRGFVTISTSTISGNRGAGLRTTAGNVATLLSHCVVAGNSAGGTVQESARAYAVSSIAYLQPPPFEGRAGVVLDVAATPAFLRAPDQYLRVTGFSNAVVNITDQQPDFGIQALCESSDDGVARRALAVSSTQVELEPAPDAQPATLAYFASEGSVDEDWRLSASSPASGVGLAAAGQIVDAGPDGAPLGGNPGIEPIGAGDLFFLAETSPVVGANLTASEDVRLTFLGGSPAASSLAGSFAYDTGSQTVTLDASRQADDVLVSPPTGGWTQGGALEVYGTLVSEDGRPLTAPIVLEYNVTP